MLHTFVDRIWYTEQPLRFFGLEIGARMTIVDISGEGELLLHSPILPNDGLLSEINNLGTVKHIVAPNLLHHLYVGHWKEKYPNANLYCCPGLERKRRDIKFDTIIEQDKTYAWSKVAQHHIVQGTPKFNEVVFFFPQHKTLLVADLGIHIHESSPFLTRCIFKAMGMFKKFGWSKLEKRFFIKDKKLFETSARKILEWDFDNILLSHGKLVESGGHKIFENAFQDKTRGP